MSKYAGVFMENGKFGVDISEDGDVEFTALSYDGEEVIVFIKKREAKDFAEEILSLIKDSKND